MDIDSDDRFAEIKRNVVTAVKGRDAAKRAAGESFQIFLSLYRHGARKFVFLNGHGGNIKMIERLGLDGELEQPGLPHHDGQSLGVHRALLLWGRHQLEEDAIGLEADASCTRGGGGCIQVVVVLAQLEAARANRQPALIGLIEDVDVQPILDAHAEAQRVRLLDAELRAG